jgi:hypothetical protein
MISGGICSPRKNFFVCVKRNRTETRVAFDRYVHIARDNRFKRGFLTVNRNDQNFRFPVSY